MDALSVQLNRGNFYGAPFPPWVQGSKPGWYYGDHPERVPPFFPGLPWLKDSVSLSHSHFHRDEH
ncbi:hypothetical protein EV421DRAFT_1716457 [Armillaria borealis]|uniref:Uncharacterized protein n=1 Tax=Armillaria borealis TaxID=47425 RepID=A0AA39J5C1_9AGAR|nr:hypothetical protein EV421DRAFT_1716457 [Armillaria borealis]